MMSSYKKYLSFWAKNRAQHIIELFWTFPISIIARIIPRGQTEIYGSMNGFRICDNSKFLFYKSKSPKSFFITKNKDICSNKNRIIYAYSFKGIYLQLSANRIFWTHGLNDFIAPLVLGSHIVGLQHGLPGKTIIQKTKNKLYYIIKDIFLPFMNNYYCHEVWSPKMFYDSYIKEVFYPLNVQVKRKQLPRIEFAPKLTKMRKILYAPSHRSFRNITDVLNDNKVTTESFIEELNSNNIQLVVRPHPLDYDEFIKSKINKYCSIDSSDDIHDTISSYSIVISDFSGLLIDCWELGIESYCLCDDLEDIFNRGIIYEWFFMKLKTKRIFKMSDALVESELIATKNESN